ncbi:MAG: hypothetical protein AAGM67_05490, partial [Bacteroidota bacterium]
MARQTQFFFLGWQDHLYAKSTTYFFRVSKKTILVPIFQTQTRACLGFPGLKEKSQHALKSLASAKCGGATQMV